MRRVIGLAIAAVTLLAWVYLFHLSRQMSAAAADDARMAAMGMAVTAQWTRTDVFLTFVMWTVMMVGMMAPSVTPVLLLAANAPRSERHVIPPVLLFGAGYLLVWVGFSAIATVTQWLLHAGALLSPAMAASSPRISGAILIGAGLYQLTPLKNMCLTHCRSPIDFLMSHWRGGRAGPIRMGMHHGLYCLGCCWALMAVLFAVGVMNLAGVVILTVFILAERVGRGGAIISRVGGVAMIGVGVVLVAAGR